MVTRKDKVGAASVDIAGYIASPVEPRIVVVVGERTRAFEGYERTCSSTEPTWAWASRSSAREPPREAGGLCGRMPRFLS